MLAVKTFNYNGQNINQRSDGYLNASQMCIANGKLFSDWNRGKSTKAYVACLSEAMGIPIADLIVVQNGNQTWIHPSLAINLARWISPAFAVWCDGHIFNLMSTGSTTLEIEPIEEMKLRIQLAALENSKSQADLQILQLRQYITTALPEPVQQKILGYQTIESVEYRDRIIAEDQLINDGSSVTKTELCKRYKYYTKNGALDFQRLKKVMNAIDLPPEAWQLKARIQDTEELRREFLPVLDSKILGDDNRQMWLGE